jgi:phage terminase large subunit-like protein
MTQTTDADLLKVWESWSDEARAQAAALLQQVKETTWQPFYCGDWACSGRPHGEWQHPHARGDQHPPRTPWDIWIELSGRGAGKTRSGAEWTHRVAEKPVRIALVSPTATDCRDILVEGESGLLATATPKNPCVYLPSKRRVEWSSGAWATMFTAEKADRLRGPQHHFAWVDEACFMANIEDVWDNLLFGLRLGKHPRIHITTTPMPRKWLKKLLKQDNVHLTTASTYANIDNLAPQFRKAVLDKYEGTRLGRQEIHAEILDDIEGALWSTTMIDDDRVAYAPKDLKRVVVSVDPAGSSRPGSDETGIVVVGQGDDDHAYVLADYSGRYSPDEWARKALWAYHEWDGDALVAETNYGGEMVVNNIRLQPEALAVPILTVVARKGKALRAEPCVALYEQHKVHHVGMHNDLEGQMTEWIPGETNDSPDRLDALVHALTLMLVKQAPGRVHNPASITRRVGDRGLAQVIPLRRGA